MKSLKNTPVLITGGAGFIGSHLTRTLLSKGAIVTVADNFSRGTRTNLKEFGENISIINTDLRTERGALQATNGQTVVFNLAAVNTGVDFDVGRTQYMFEENMLLQMMPLRAAAKNKVHTFIQVSSASIYSTESMEKRVPTKESDDSGYPESSKQGYALAKKMGEYLAGWYSENSTMRTVIARFINVYGTHDNYDDLGHFIPTIVKKFHNARNHIEIFGSGRQKRSFIHVNDAISGLLVLSSRGINGQAYNIDAQDEHTIKEIVVLIQKIMGKKHIRLVFNTDLPEGSKRRMLDTTKINKLGWKPKHEILSSLPEIIEDITERLS
jgi:nucleoside-diphosphate-sugar epimerase